jgi:histidine ammonia-lyase
VASTEAALERYADTIVAELVLASRAVTIAGRAPAGRGTRALQAAIAAALPGDLEDRPLAGDLQVARRVLDANAVGPPPRPV